LLRSANNGSWIANYRKKVGVYHLKQTRKARKARQNDVTTLPLTFEPKSLVGLLACLLLVQASIQPVAAKRHNWKKNSDTATPGQKNNCELTTRSAFAHTNYEELPNPIVIEPSVYQTFANCSKNEVKNYLKKATVESIATSPFADEIRKNRYLHNVTVKFTANPSSFFPPEQRGEANFEKHEMTGVVSRSTALLSPHHEHLNEISSLRHEWTHL